VGQQQRVAPQLCFENAETALVLEVFFPHPACRAHGDDGMAHGDIGAQWIDGPGGVPQQVGSDQLVGKRRFLMARGELSGGGDQLLNGVAPFAAANSRNTLALSRSLVEGGSCLTWLGATAAGVGATAPACPAVPGAR
jgi:hypothetical protein